MAVTLRITFIGLVTFVQREDGITRVLLPATHNHHHGGGNGHVPQHFARLYLGKIADVAKGGGPVPWSIPLDRSIVTIRDNKRAGGLPRLPAELFSMRAANITPSGVKPETLTATPPAAVVFARVDLDLHGHIDAKGAGEVELKVDGDVLATVDMATFVVWTEIVDPSALEISIRSIDGGPELALHPAIPAAENPDPAVDLMLYYVPVEELPPAEPPKPKFKMPVEHFEAYYALFAPTASKPLPFPKEPGPTHGGVTGGCMNIQE